MPFTTAGAFNLLYRFGSSTKADTQFQPQVDADLEDIAAGLATLETQVGGTGSAPGGSPGDVQYNNSGVFGGLTDTQLTARINDFTSTLSGSAPFSGGGTTNFLRADGAWALPPGGGTSSPGGSTGDIQYNNAGSFGGLTNTQVTARINAFTSSLSGAAPASGGGTLHFLRADGNWVEPAASGLASQIIYVMQPPYNAAVNGTTDDTAAIQAAIAAAASNGDVVHLGYGTSIVDGLTVPSNIEIRGYGMGRSILKRKNSAAQNLVIGGTSVTNIYLRDFSVDGNKASNAVLAHNVRFTSSSKITVQRIESYNSLGHGGVFTTGTDTLATRSFVLNCYLHNNTIVGWSCNVSPYVTFSYNVIDTCGHGFTAFDNTNPHVAETVNGIIVIGNTVTNIGSTGDGDGISVGGFVESYNGSGTPIWGISAPTSRNCIVANNTVRSCGSYGITFQCDSSVLISNDVRACGSTSGATPGGNILVNSVRSAIVGNTMLDGVNYAMDAGGSWYCTLSGNYFGRVTNTGTHLNLGGGVKDMVSGNIFEVSANCTGINIQGIDGGDTNSPFGWVATGLSVVANKFVGDPANTANTLGIYCHNAPQNVYIADNVFHDFDDFRAIKAELRGGFITNNKVNTANSLTFAQTYTAASTTVIPDYAETCDITGSTPINSIFTDSQNVFNQRVLTVRMTNMGTGYTPNTPFAVGFSGGGGGAGAAATAEVTSQGTVVGVIVTNPGSGYTSAPSASFSLGAGSSAAGTVLVGVDNTDNRLLTLFGAPRISTTAGNINIGSHYLGESIQLRGRSNQWWVQSTGVPDYSAVATAADNGANTGGTATLDSLAGVITTSDASGVAENANYILVVNNDNVLAGDVVTASVDNATNSAGLPSIQRITTASGSFTVRIRNVFGSGASFNGTLTCAFLVTKAVVL